MLIKNLIPKYLHNRDAIFYKNSSYVAKSLIFPVLTSITIFYRIIEFGLHPRISEDHYFNPEGKFNLNVFELYDK